MKGQVQTVSGPISPDELGITLPHEHILIDLRCHLKVLPPEASYRARIFEPLTLENLWWVRQNLLNEDNLLLTDVEGSIREVMEFKRHGGNSIVDVTNIGLGRDPVALRNISNQTGINIIMGSGYYVGAAHPPDMSSKTVEDIADEITKDVTTGVGTTGIKAGIIGEIGINNIEDDPNEVKSLRAGITAQKETGAPLTIHPSLFRRECEGIIEILDEEGADMKRVIMSHSELFVDESMDYSFMIADAGLYVEYDTWGLEGNWPDFGLIEPSDTQRLEGMEKLIDNGYLDQILLSQDICMKTLCMAYGGTGYAHILRDCLPLFRKAGISEEEMVRMLEENPKRILQFG